MGPFILQAAGNARRFASATVLCPLLLVLSGCASLQTQSRVNPATIAAYGNHDPNCPLTSGLQDTRKGAIDLDCFQFPEDQGTSNNNNGGAPDGTSGNPPKLPTETAYKKAVATKDDRNRLTSILIKHSDDVCTVEMGNLTANEAITNTSLSIANSGLSIASTIVGGEQAKSILSGLAAFAGASRDHANTHVYRSTVSYALAQVITAERDTKLGLIHAKYGVDEKAWSIDDATRAVNDYHQQCSLSVGLKLLMKAANNSADFQSNKTARANQDKIDRIEREIKDLEARSALVTDGAKTAIDNRINELVLEKSRVGIQ